jgi:hypothetical protein
MSRKLKKLLLIPVFVCALNLPASGICDDVVSAFDGAKDQSAVAAIIKSFIPTFLAYAHEQIVSRLQYPTNPSVLPTENQINELLALTQQMLLEINSVDDPRILPTFQHNNDRVPPRCYESAVGSQQILLKAVAFHLQNVVKAVQHLAYQSLNRNDSQSCIIEIAIIICKNCSGNPSADEFTKFDAIMASIETQHYLTVANQIKAKLDDLQQTADPVIAIAPHNVSAASYGFAKDFAYYNDSWQFSYCLMMAARSAIAAEYHYHDKFDVARLLTLGNGRVGEAAISASFIAPIDPLTCATKGLNVNQQELGTFIVESNIRMGVSPYKRRWQPLNNYGFPHIHFDTAVGPFFFRIPMEALPFKRIIYDLLRQNYGAMLSFVQDLYNSAQCDIIEAGQPKAGQHELVASMTTFAMKMFAECERRLNEMLRLLNFGLR